MASQAGRTEDLQGLQAAGDGGREDQIGVAGGVVGVEMGDENAGQLLHLRPSLGGAADHARSAIHQVDAIARHHGHRRAHALGIGIGIARAQQNHAGVLGQRCDRRS